MRGTNQAPGIVKVVTAVANGDLSQKSLASIPVVMVTADGDAHGKAASIQAAGYVSKPLQIDSLLDEVERICGLPEP